MRTITNMHLFGALASAVAVSQIVNRCVKRKRDVQVDATPWVVLNDIRAHDASMTAPSPRQGDVEQQELCEQFSALSIECDEFYWSDLKLVGEYLADEFMYDRMMEESDGDEVDSMEVEVGSVAARYCSRVVTDHVVEEVERKSKRIKWQDWVDEVHFDGADPAREVDAHCVIHPILQPAAVDVTTHKLSSSPPPPPPQVPLGSQSSQGPKPSMSKYGFKRDSIWNFSLRCRANWESEERAAAAKAVFLSLGTNGEEDIAYRSGLSLFAKLRNLAIGRKATNYHRASNKFFKRVKILRELRDEMLFDSVGQKRVKTPLNEAAAEELARRVVARAVENGRISDSERRWYRQGLVETFFIRDDDDAFWGGVGAAPEPVSA